MAAQVGWDENLARAFIDERSELEGAMLPILHALQEKFGYVDSRAVAIIASALNVSRSEVFGTLSFYHDFKRQPPLGRTIKLCRAEACQARGAEDLASHLEKSCGAKIDGGYQNGVSVETAYCLGNCALGPTPCLTARFSANSTPTGLGRPMRAPAKSAGARNNDSASIFPATPPPCRSAPNPVAKALAREAAARGLIIEIVRNGSHGMFWLEPLVEFDTPQGRVGYGPVPSRTSPRCSTQARCRAATHPLRLGPIDRSRLDEAPAAPDFCARRHDRSAFAGGLSRS